MNRTSSFLAGLMVTGPLLACSGLTPPMGNSSFTARVSISGATLFVFNDSDTAWVNVVASPEDTLSCTIGAIPAKGQGQIALKDCTGTPPSIPVSQVRVASAQGEYVATIPPVDLVSILAPTPEPTATPAPEPAATPTQPNRTPEPTPSGLVVKGAMKVSGSMSGGFGPARRITINNETDEGWSGCKVTLNDSYHYSLGSLSAHTGEGIMLVRFKDSGGNVLTSNAQILKAVIKCNQGAASFTPR